MTTPIRVHVTANRDGSRQVVVYRAAPTQAPQEEQERNLAMPRPSAAMNLPRPGQRETALAAEWKDAKARRLSTYAVQRNAAVHAQAQDYLRWADPQLLERVGAAKRTLEAANLNLRRTGRRLHEKHRAERDRQREIAGANRVELPGHSLPGVDPIASRMTDDPEWKLAQATVVKAKGDLLAAGKAVERSAQSRRAELGNLEREVRLRRAAPSEDDLLERITGDGRTGLETELALRRLLTADHGPK